MAYSRTFSGWRYRNKYGTRSSRRWKSGSRLRALGNAKAARQQRDSATVTINKISQITATIPANESASSVIINHWNMLRLSDYFPNYAPMYDQMKLNKIRVKLTGFRAGTAQTANISPAVILAFDRNGLNPGQTVSPALISTYSSAQLKQWSTGNSFSMYQSIYPSTIMEKGQYIPTSSLDDPSDNTEPTNPCANESDSTLPFKPITLLSVDLGATVGAAAQTFAFTAEFEYTVTFRGMRKPSLSSSLVLGPFADTVTENGRYIVTAEQAGVDGWNSIDVRVNVPQTVTVGYLAYSFVLTGTTAPSGTFVISSLTSGSTQTISGDDERRLGSYGYYDSSDRMIHWVSTGTSVPVSITLTSTQYFLFSYKYFVNTVRATSVTIYDRNNVLVASLGNLSVGGTVYVPENVVVDLN